MNLKWTAVFSAEKKKEQRKEVRIQIQVNKEALCLQYLFFLPSSVWLLQHSFSPTLPVAWACVYAEKWSVLNRKVVSV